MAQMKILSQTTRGHNMQLRSWLAELVMLRTYGKLKPYFWRDSRWRGIYTQEVKAVSKFIKNYGNRAIVMVAENPFIKTFTDYANIEWRIQEFAKSDELIRKPKDFEPPISPISQGEDLRDYEIKKTNKISLFDRLDSYEH